MATTNQHAPGGHNFLASTILVDVNSTTSTTDCCEGNGSQDLQSVWWMDVLRVLVTVLVPVCGVVGNSLVILSVTKGLVKQTKAYILVANLAVTDLLFSLQNVIFAPLPLILNR